MRLGGVTKHSPRLRRLPPNSCHLESSPQHALSSDLARNLASILVHLLAYSPREQFHIFSSLLKLPTPPPPSSLSAFDLDCYFLEKIETIRRELPQVPTNTSTRPPASGPIYAAFSTVTRNELSVFLSLNSRIVH